MVRHEGGVDIIHQSSASIADEGTEALLESARQGKDGAALEQSSLTDGRAQLLSASQPDQQPDQLQQYSISNDTRHIGLVRAVGLVISYIIGSGIFAVPVSRTSSPRLPDGSGSHSTWTSGSKQLTPVLALVRNDRV